MCLCCLVISWVTMCWSGSRAAAHDLSVKISALLCWLSLFQFSGQTSTAFAPLFPTCSTQVEDWSHSPVYGILPILGLLGPLVFDINPSRRKIIHNLHCCFLIILIILILVFDSLWLFSYYTVIPGLLYFIIFIHLSVAFIVILMIRTILSDC